MKAKGHSFTLRLLWIVLLLMAAPQAFAIIRPPYPAKTAPPFRGHIIVIGGDSTLTVAENTPATAAKPAK
jgi:hypothetical protein